MMGRDRTFVLAIGVCLTASVCFASGGKPLPTRPPKTPQATSQKSAEQVYNDGLALAGRGDFITAEVRYREAIKLNPKLPEAWNGLGHALKMQRRFDEAVVAYNQALELRPDFPLAMEYLGELYVATGEFDKARDLLSRLQMVDNRHADELALAIKNGSAGW